MKALFLVVSLVVLFSSSLSAELVFRRSNVPVASPSPAPSPSRGGVESANSAFREYNARFQEFALGSGPGPDPTPTPTPTPPCTCTECAGLLPVIDVDMDTREPRQISTDSVTVGIGEGMLVGMPCMCYIQAYGPLDQSSWWFSAWVYARRVPNDSVGEIRFGSPSCPCLQLPSIAVNIKVPNEMVFEPVMGLESPFNMFSPGTNIIGALVWFPAHLGPGSVSFEWVLFREYAPADQVEVFPDGSSITLKAKDLPYLRVDSHNRLVDHVGVESPYPLSALRGKPWSCQFWLYDEFQDETVNWIRFSHNTYTDEFTSSGEVTIKVESSSNSQIAGPYGPWE